MNIFYLSEDIDIAVENHVDAHVRKMVIEYAQLLSTCHRVLDGVPYWTKKNNRRYKHYKLNDEREEQLAMCCYHNHPCNKWLRMSSGNYWHLFKMFERLLEEYTFRFDTIHGCYKFLEPLRQLPLNIPDGDMTPPQISEVKYLPSSLGESVLGNREYYIRTKQHLAVWTKRETPLWWRSVK